MDKKLSLTAAAALAVGFGAGVVAPDFTASAAHRTENASVSKDLSAGVSTILESVVKAQACPEINAKYGRGTCRVKEHLSTLYIRWHRGPDGPRTRMVAGFEMPGTWTPGK